MHRFPALLVLVLALAASAAAQQEWAPRYILSPKSQQPATTSPEPQKPPEKPVEFNDESAPPPAAPTSHPQQPATTPAEPQKPPARPVREFNDEETSPPPAPAAATPAPAQTPAAPAPGMTPREKEMRDIAERFAPVLYHRMAGTPEEHRFDYPTNFDFDGD